MNRTTPSTTRWGRNKEGRKGVGWSEAELNEEKRKPEQGEGSRQPPAGCCCWKPDKGEQISAAGSSNLSAAAPSHVTSQPSLGTGASLGTRTLTPPGPPGREGATGKNRGSRGKVPLPQLPPPSWLLRRPPSAGLVQTPGQPLVKVSHAEQPTPSRSASPPQVLENSLQEMTIYVPPTAPQEREQETGSNSALFEMCEVFEPQKPHNSLCSQEAHIRLTLAGYGPATTQASSPYL